MPESHKDLQNQELTNPAEIDFAKSLAILLQKYPELARIIEAWPVLDVDTRRQIVSMIGESPE